MVRFSVKIMEKLNYNIFKFEFLRIEKVIEHL